MKLHRPSHKVIANRLGRSAFLLALLALSSFGFDSLAQKTLDSKPRQPEARASRNPVQYTIEQFMDTVRIGGASFSPDEKQILFHNNKSGIFNVYTVNTVGGKQSN